MTDSKSLIGHRDAGRLKGEFGPELKELEPVCPFCLVPLQHDAKVGGQEVFRCLGCNVPVKPLVLSLEDKAAKTRDNLRVLILQETVPDQLATELVSEIDHKFWTRLRGVNNKRFTDFDDFCRDPNGLRADPTVVRALLVKLRGRNATKLITLPPKRQGHRTDLEPTSRPKDEKSETPSSDTRCRRIQSGPPEVLRAFSHDHLQEKEAARVASFARENPESPELKSILLDLKCIPAEEKPKAILAGICARIQSLPLARADKRKGCNDAPRGSSAASTPGVPSSSSGVTRANSTTPGSPAAAVDGPAGVHRHLDVGPTCLDAAGPGPGAHGSTTELELALLRFLDGGRAMDRLGLADVDSAALVRILGEARAAARLPDTRRLAEELLLLQEVAQLASALGTTFAHHADLRKIAMREAQPVPAIVQGARDEVARRLKSTNAVRKASLPRGAKTRNVA
jgi:hypothetical protein